MSNLFRLRYVGQGLFWICCHSHLCNASSPIQRSCFPSPTTTSLSSSWCFQQPLDQNSFAATSTPVPGWSLARTPSRHFHFWGPELVCGWKKCHVQAWFLDVFCGICWEQWCLPLLAKCFRDGFGAARHPRGTRALPADQSPSDKCIFQIYAGPFVQWAAPCAVIASLCTCLFSFISGCCF